MGRTMWMRTKRIAIEQSGSLRGAAHLGRCLKRVCYQQPSTSRAIVKRSVPIDRIDETVVWVLYGQRTKSNMVAGQSSFRYAHR
jgi:hypothetical protein